MLGERIKERRKALQLSAEALAEKLDVIRNTVYRWEAGERTPSDEGKRRIALVLDTSVAYLMGETNDPVRYSESLLSAAGKRPEEMSGNPPAPLSSDEKRRREMLIRLQSGEGVSSDIEETSALSAERPSLSYWARVVDNARAAVKRGDLKELQEIDMMLRKATVPVEDALMANKANAQLTLPDSAGKLTEQVG